MSQSILVICGHPALHISRANVAMSAAIASLSNVTQHDLYQEYPDFFIDVNREQQLLREHEVIVFQHPLQWYSCPALIKEWMDVVLEHDFAYGKHGKELAGKVWLSVVTTGGGADAYTATSDDNGANGAIGALFLPFKRSAQLCSMKYLEPLVYHGIAGINQEQIVTLAEDYKQQLMKLGARQ